MELLALQANEWSIRLDPPRLTLLAAYADLLAGYELSNVIGTRDRKEITIEHLLDALSCLTLEEARTANSLLDVGSGSGLPGMPLGIIRPELETSLLEATEKKVRFLQHAKTALDLPNITVLGARAEDIARETGFRESYDLATARALASLPVVVEYCVPFVCVGGTILAMKARLSEEELSEGMAAARELGARLREVREVDYLRELPQKDRRLVVFDKVEATSDKYPRRVGLARKRPLGRSGCGKS